MKRTITWLSIFAIAMAFLEAAIVVYLRELYYPEDVQAIFPSKLFSWRDLIVELFREAATVIMMISVAALTVRGNFTRAFAAFVYVFGLWDVFYYGWLKVTIGWPVALLEWDVLFLIPWVWLGPWICPVLISFLFIGWGAWILLTPDSYKFSKTNAGLFIIGALIALISFLQPAVPVLLEKGREGLLNFLPDNFWWPVFIIGYLLMVTSLGRIILEGRRKSKDV